MYTEYQEQKKKNKKTWILNKWWEKTIFIVGVIYSTLFIIGFTIGLTGVKF